MPVSTSTAMENNVMENTVVEVTDLVKSYRQRDNRKSVRAVDGVSFTVKPGEVLGVIGESGCGKSTLGKMLVGLEKPDAGAIRYAGKPVNEWLRSDPLSFRRFTQIIFQNPFDTFDPRYSIGTILTGVLKLHRIGRDHHERRELAATRLEQAGLAPGERFLERYPHELSGGQLQRVSILRSMLLDPKFLVADEPVSMLDASIQADILNLLADLSEQHQTAMLFISHDIGSIRYLADQIAVMYQGRFIEYGDADAVWTNPRHPYTRALILSSLRAGDKTERNALDRAGKIAQPAANSSGCPFYARCIYRSDACQVMHPELAEVGPNHWVRCLNE